MFRPGQEVGNYRVEGLVGRGGQGVVYRAVHVRLGTNHAVKMLLADVGALRERLLEEGRIQARLRNPHVVPVTDVVEVDGALGLVAEYVAGAPLDAWIAAEDPSVETRIAVFRDLCEGVAAAHAARIVHRDLKPGNVLVEQRDGRPFARVTDFGVAKVLDDARGRIAATLPGMAVGTPGYMAPEQLRDAATVDARADVFALGCLLHELVAGARAFPETDLVQYAFALETRRRAPVGSLTGVSLAVAERVDAVIAACLAYDAAARPPDAAAVLAALDGAPLPAPMAPVVTSAPRTPTAVPLEAHVAAHAAGQAGGPSAAHAPRTSAPTSVPAAYDAEDVFAEPEPRRGIGAVGAVVAGVIVLLGAAFAVAVVSGREERVVVAIEEPVAADVQDPPPSEDEALASGASEPVATAPPPTRGTVAPGAPSAPRASSAPAPDVERPTPAAGPARPSRSAAEIDRTPLAEPAPRTGRVVAEGDGELVALVAGDTVVSPSAAPPGHYTVRARFGADGVVDAGVVSVQAGDTVRLRCNAVALRCVLESK